MKSVIRGKNRGIQWVLTDHLEGLDFVDDILIIKGSVNPIKVFSN